MMHTRIRQFILMAATALFCTVAFSSALTGAADEISPGGSDNPWLESVSESTNQVPLLLAKGSKKVKGSKGSKKKVYVYYCKVKQAKGSKPAKYKTKKGSQKKVDKKIAKDKKGKYFYGKCEDIFSIS